MTIPATGFGSPRNGMPERKNYSYGGSKPLTAEERAEVAAHSEKSKATGGGGQKRPRAHGTYLCYRDGCKRPECIQAGAEARRQWKAARKAREGAS